MRELNIERWLVGERVEDTWTKDVGEVVRWQPWNVGNDVLLRRDDGSEIWTSSHMLRFCARDGVEGQPLGDIRQRALRLIDQHTLTQLQSIRAQHVKDFHKPWPGAEFGKAHVGQMLDAGIAEVRERLNKGRSG